MATIRNQIVDAIVSALSAAGKPAELTVERFRLSAIEEPQLPNCIVAPKEEESTRVGGHKASPLMDRRLVLNLIFRVALEDGEFVDEALDKYMAWGTKAIQASGTLGGLAVAVNELRTRWDGEQAMQGFGMAVQEIEVRYVTNTKDQEQK